MSVAESKESQRIKSRLEHLQTIGLPAANSAIAWNKEVREPLLLTSRHFFPSGTFSIHPSPSLISCLFQRLDRILVDHLLRQGHHETAVKLCCEAGLEQLCDTQIFDEARKVRQEGAERGPAHDGVAYLGDFTPDPAQISPHPHAEQIRSALRQHDCGPALIWCTENRSRLKKMKSKLEFKLRVQEFVERVRCKNKMDAILYAREHLAPWAQLYMQVGRGGACWEGGKCRGEGQNQVRASPSC